MLPLHPSLSMNPKDVIETLESDDYGYFNVLHVPECDIYGGLTRLMFTVAICYDLRELGYAERYCFDDPRLAKRELLAWHERGFNDQRPVGWIACRGVDETVLLNSFNKHYPDGYAGTTLSFIESNIESSIGLFEKAGEISRIINQEEEITRHHIAYLFSAGIIKK